MAHRGEKSMREKTPFNGGLYSFKSRQISSLQDSTNKWTFSSHSLIDPSVGKEYSSPINFVFISLLAILSWILILVDFIERHQPMLDRGQTPDTGLGSTHLLLSFKVTLKRQPHYYIRHCGRN